MSNLDDILMIFTRANNIMYRETRNFPKYCTPDVSTKELKAFRIYQFTL